MFRRCIVQLYLQLCKSKAWLKPRRPILNSLVSWLFFLPAFVPECTGELKKFQNGEVVFSLIQNTSEMRAFVDISGVERNNLSNCFPLFIWIGWMTLPHLCVCAFVIKFGTIKKTSKVVTLSWMYEFIHCSKAREKKLSSCVYRAQLQDSAHRHMLVDISW